MHGSKLYVDDWIAGKIGLPPGAVLDRASLEAWQLARLRETVARVLTNSSFYRERFASILGTAGILRTDRSDERANPMSSDAPNADCISDAVSVYLASLNDLSKLPFTTPDDLAAQGSRMVCVSARDVNRIVTLQPLATTGTTGDPKRVWFTEADQELMTDYIHHGLPVMTGPDDVFLILMPCERPGSVGDLVALGVERIGSRAVRIGAIPADGSRDEDVLKIIQTEGVTTGLMTASTAARLARKSVDRMMNPGCGTDADCRPKSKMMKSAGLMADHGCSTDADCRPQSKMRTVLLSAQFVSGEDLEAIETCWNCKAYEHYGMTEMGLGGAMACEVREGYHPREADLLFEIIDPDTGAVLPDGEYGEVVFTTLTRQAMPLIRYRTGDYSRFLPTPCRCGSVLKRLDKVGDRPERKPY
jgi:phenylacetate-coenzyme A ligase PaaK-like adenylate-forming protein